MALTMKGHWTKQIRLRVQKLEQIVMTRTGLLEENNRRLEQDLLRWRCVNGLSSSAVVLFPFDPSWEKDTFFHSHPSHSALMTVGGQFQR